MFGIIPLVYNVILKQNVPCKAMQCSSIICNAPHLNLPNVTVGECFFDVNESLFVFGYSKRRHDNLVPNLEKIDISPIPI